MSDSKADLPPKPPLKLGPQRSKFGSRMALRPDTSRGRLRKQSSDRHSPSLSSVSNPMDIPSIDSQPSSARNSQSSTASASPPVTAYQPPAKQPKDLQLSSSKTDTIKSSEEKQKNGEERKDKSEAKISSGDSDEKGEKSVDQASEVVMKHPLQNEWTMSFSLPSAKQSGDTFTAQITEIVTFGTAEDFWRLFNNLREPEKLPLRSDYHLFKKGIMPAWEDPANAKGGKWVVELQRHERDSLNQAWLLTSLAMIGETFGPVSAEDICGCVVSLRPKKMRLSLWTKTAEKFDLQQQIGVHLKKVLDIPNCPKLSYQKHHDANGKGLANYATKTSQSV